MYSMIILQSYVIVWHIDILKEQWCILHWVMAGNGKMQTETTVKPRFNVPGFSDDFFTSRQ
jgi:hypothetical protein